MTILLAVVGGCSQSEAPVVVNTAAIDQIDIINIRAPQNEFYSSGQPTKEQFRTLQEAGVKHIVNLRPADEQDWDEAALVKSLGMRYHSIPVAGLEGISAKAQALDQLLDSLQGETVLVHCRSGNRVGALVALAEAEIRGNDIESALATGRRWGLTSLEPAVRKELSEH